LAYLRHQYLGQECRNHRARWWPAVAEAVPGQRPARGVRPSARRPAGQPAAAGRSGGSSCGRLYPDAEEQTRVSGPSLPRRTPAEPGPRHGPGPIGDAQPASPTNNASRTGSGMPASRLPGWPVACRPGALGWPGWSWSRPAPWLYIGVSSGPSRAPPLSRSARCSGAGGRPTEARA